jgi:hypothetical protein
MIESINIRNFRCFKDAEVSGLKRVNLIVGKNGSGKTALLESIFLASGGSAELALRIRALRGMGQVLQLSVDRSGYESLWKDLFSGLDQSQTIYIGLKGSAANSRAVTIAYSKQLSLTLPLGKTVLDSPLIVPITFQWKDNRDEVTETVEVRLGEGGLTVGGTREAVPAFFFAGTTSSNPFEGATRFSDLDKAGRADLVIDRLRQEFPDVQEISVQISAGVPGLYAKVRQFPEKFPVGVLSGGINKLLSLLLALADKPQGVVLIDEIENGFYFDRLTSIWSLLWGVAKERDSQIFASTHSRECLQAILPLVAQEPEEVALIRTDRINGECEAEVFRGDQLASALKLEVDVR